MSTTSEIQAKRKVVFVLGGPGAGKGTVCGNLIKDFGFVHLSAGDLLRDEVEKKGPQGELIANIIKEGAIVPQEITIGLLARAMDSRPECPIFLIDGFPRAIEQANAFEQQVQACEFLLFLECPEETMEKRLLKRGETSGRTDDNIESIKKRFRTYVTQTQPVIEHYRTLGKTREVDSSPPADEVYAKVRKIFESL